MKTIKHALGQRLVKCGKALLDQRQDAIPEPARADGKSPTLASNTLDVDRGSAGLSGSTSIASSSTVGPVETSAPKHTKPSANEPIKTVTISAPQVETDAIIHPTCQSTQDQSATNVLSKITGYIRTVKGHTAQIESAAIFLDKITGKKSPFGTGEAAVMVKDFLKRFSKGVPGAEQFIACVEIILDHEAAFRASHNRASDLYDKVIFVLQSTASLYSDDWTVDSRPVNWVLKNLKSAIEECLVLFESYRKRGFWSKLIFAHQIVGRFASADSTLKDTLEYLNFLLMVDSRQQAADSAAKLCAVLNSHSHFPKPSGLSKKEQQVQSAISKANGGIESIQRDPSAIQHIAVELSDYTPLTEDDVQELQVDFNTYCSEMKNAMSAILQRLDSQGADITETKNKLIDLADRGSMFVQIACPAVRIVWIKAGWGARVKLTEFQDVIVEEMRTEVEHEIHMLVSRGTDGIEYVGQGQAIYSRESAIATLTAFTKRLKFWGLSAESASIPTKAAVMAEVARRFQHFSTLLQYMDVDASGTLSPAEVNSFFLVSSWTLLDYFRYLTIYLPKSEYDGFVELQARFKSLVDKMGDLTTDTSFPCASFLCAAHHLLQELQMQAGSERHAMKWTNFRTTMLPLLDKKTLKSKMPPWDEDAIPHQHMLPAVRQLHKIKRVVAQVEQVLEEKRIKSQDALLVWRRLLKPNFSDLLKATQDWAPGAAAVLEELLDSASVWYSDQGHLYTDAEPDSDTCKALAKYTCMYSTPTRPLIGTAWFPHNLPPHNQRPSNAVVGGTVRNHLVYLTKCDLASTDGRWHQVCGYAYESVTADGLVVMAPNGPIVPDMQYSWLLHERDPRRSEDSSIFVPVPSRGTWVTFDLESVPNPCSAMLGHGQGTSTAWLGRACIPNGNASAYSLPTQSQNEISGSDPDVVGGGGTGADHVRGNDLLPGTIFLHRGQLEFMTSRLEPNGSTTVLSTIANGGRDVFISAKDASRSYNYVHIPRSGKNAISFSLLEMQRNQSWNQFYTRFDWMPLVAEGRDIDGCVYEPVVMCGKPYLPGYLAWCLGPSSVHLGMCFPSVSRELAFYYAPAGSGQVKVGGDEALIPTSKFLVLMSKNDDSETQAEASKSSLNYPAPNLLWLPSPLLSGNEWNGAVLQLLLVSTAETQEPVPVTRQQNRNLIPSFGALGRGAFTVRSGPTINDQKPGIMPPPTTASLTDTVRTEYLYMALLSSKEKHSQPFNIMMQTPVPSPRNGT